MPQPTYDVFIALADTDRQGAQGLITSLSECGLDVFVDEGAVNTADGMTAEDALKQSRLMVPYYSQRFVYRSHCQRALMTAFLAGHRGGDPLKYIAAVNPEDPVTEHIVPIEVADARYVVMSDMPGAAQKFEAKVASNPNTIGGAPAPEPAPWIGRPKTTIHSPERYRELWQLHDALEIGEYPFIRGSMRAYGGVAVIAGASESGKTDLAATYAQLFGAQYQGGVYWLSLRGCSSDAAAVRNRYDEELRRISVLAGLGSAATLENKPLERISHYLDAQQAPSLWIIDDIPDGFDKDLLWELIVPEKYARLHTIFISRHVSG